MQLNSHLVSQALGPAAAGNPASALAVNPAALATALAAAAPQQAPPQQAAAGLGLGLTSAALAAALAAASQSQAPAGAQQAQAQAHAGVHAGAWGAAHMPRSVAPAREPEQMTPAAPMAGAAKKLSVLNLMPTVAAPAYESEQAARAAHAVGAVCGVVLHGLASLLRVGSDTSVSKYLHPAGTPRCGCPRPCK